LEKKVGKENFGKTDPESWTKKSGIPYFLFEKESRQRKFWED